MPLNPARAGGRVDDLCFVPVSGDVAGDAAVDDGAQHII